MEDREMRVREREREKQKRTSDGAWRWCELNGHAHIRRGHDSTRRLSPAGSILSAAMLFWLLFSRHTHTHRHTLIHGQWYTYSHPKCHGFGESWAVWADEGPGLMETPNSLL